MNPIESIPARFARVVTQHAHRVAVSAPDGEWTYAELDQRSTALAHFIVEQAPGDQAPVVLLMEHGAPLVAAILGVLKAGQIYLSLDAHHPQARLAAMIEVAQPGLILADANNINLARALAVGGIRVLEISDHSFANSKTHALPEVIAESGAWLMFTSGSTGVPKGVWQNHAGVVHHAKVYAELVQLQPEDRLSLLTSTSLAASATHLFTALLHGATLCPFHLRSQGVERLARWLVAQRITVYHSVPTVFRHLMRSGGPECLAHIRVARLGGESVLQGDVALFQQHCAVDAVLINALSSTETGLFSAARLEKTTQLPGWRVPVGRPMGDAQVLLLDETGKPVAVGMEGRIAIQSAYLAQGYWKRPEASNEVFKSDIASPGKRLFISGDVGKFLPDGSLEHLGRADRQVKIRGQRIDVSEIEAAMRADERVLDVAVIATDAESEERRLVAYVVPRAGKIIEPSEMRRGLRETLPAVMIPSDVVLLTQLPQTPAGKLDRKALPPPPPKAQVADRDRPMPRDGIEQKLANVWQSVLGLKDVGRCEDFFDLGGTSIQSAQVLTRLEEIFNVTLSPSTLLEHGTIESLADFLADRAIIQTANPLVRLRSAASGRPLFLIHPGRGDLAMYGQLVRRLPERTIYGVQAVGLQGEAQPLRSIHVMAQRYIKEILAVDATGPYHLAGTCMGGLIAFEMALELKRMGRPIGLLALMNANHPGAKSERRESPVESVRDFFRVARWSVLFCLGWARKPKWLPACRHFVQNMHSRARRHYRPGIYPGTVTIIATTDMPDPKTDLRLRMIQHAKEARTFRIEGNRASLFIEPGVVELAQHLQSCMEAAEANTNAANAVPA